MKTLKEYLPFVKSHILIQENLANKFNKPEYPEYKSKLHIKSAYEFSQLFEIIDKSCKYIEELEKRPSEALAPQKSQSLELTYDEIEGLPEDLIKELSVSDTDKIEYLIRTIINEAGGTLNLDRIIIGLYKQTNEIHKRTAITARLYRMVQRGTVSNVPGKKGVYSTEIKGSVDL